MHNLSDKNIKLIFAVSAILIGISVFYGFVIRPYGEDKPYRECMESAEKAKETKEQIESYSPLDVFIEYETAKEECFRKFKK